MSLQDGAAPPSARAGPSPLRVPAPTCREGSTARREGRGPPSAALTRPSATLAGCARLGEPRAGAPARPRSRRKGPWAPPQLCLLARVLGERPWTKSGCQGMDTECASLSARPRVMTTVSYLEGGCPLFASPPRFFCSSFSPTVLTREISRSSSWAPEADWPFRLTVQDPRTWGRKQR